MPSRNSAAAKVASRMLIAFAICVGIFLLSDLSYCGLAQRSNARSQFEWMGHVVLKSWGAAFGIGVYAYINRRREPR